MLRAGCSDTPGAFFVYSTCCVMSFFYDVGCQRMYATPNVIPKLCLCTVMPVFIPNLFLGVK